MAEESERWVEGYLRQAALAPRLSSEDSALLALRAHDGDPEARESLVAASRRIVVTTARRYIHALRQEDGWNTRSSRFHDDRQLAALLRKGEMGLLTAVDRFEESKGFSFRTYAIWWIQQAIEGTQGDDPVGDREPTSPHPQTPGRAAHLDVPDTGS